MKNSSYIPLIITLAFLLSGCEIENTGHASSSSEGVFNESSHELTKIHCGSCHKYPEPSLLDKTSWQNAVLPRMGNMMGIYSTPNERAELIENKLTDYVFPPKPTISLEKWDKIKSFYLEQAPDSLEQRASNVSVGLPDFKVLLPEYKTKIPSSTLVKFMSDESIYIGEAIARKLVQFDENLEFIKEGNMIEGVVHLEESSSDYWILSMGSFSPTDNASGMLIKLPKDEKNQALIIADQLRRPVHASYGDLNKDGRMDIVISEFAKWTGRVSILYNTGNNQFDKVTLANQMGPVKSILKDFNDDGLVDIITLFAQGNEGISIFYNQGDNSFKREQVIQFSPSNGSTFFDLIDFDMDGDDDILYTAGDNADFTPILKPYHGIYLFENEGKNTFSQKLFIPLHGAYAAKMDDFDLDGDLDIASISFFPDYRNKAEESFVYFRNEGNFDFSASTFQNNTMGRWIVMDVKDKDNDGDKDIILGSLVFETIPDNGYVEKWLNLQIPYVVLENQSRN